MSEEHFFTCPYCLETISMVLDISVEGRQQYIEDCEVCCRPIQIEFEIASEALQYFEAVKAQE